MKFRNARSPFIRTQGSCLAVANAQARPLTLLAALLLLAMFPRRSVAQAQDAEDEQSANDQTSTARKNKTKGDPVVLVTGSFQVTETDFTIPGRGMDFEFTRRELSP